METKLKIWCDSCGHEMNLDPKEYEEHIRKYHPKKVNNKRMCFNATIWRWLDE